MKRRIERIVYVPSKLVLVSGESEDDILRKVWEKVKDQYNGNELSVFISDICVKDQPESDVPEPAYNPWTQPPCLKCGEDHLTAECPRETSKQSAPGPAQNPVTCKNGHYLPVELWGHECPICKHFEDQDAPEPAENETYTDPKTNLTWQVQTNPTKMSWQEAMDYCQDLTLGGFDDWRLPTIRELLSIVDYKSYNPAIDTDIFPDTVSSYYWSSTTYAHLTNYAWLVNFSIGYDTFSNKSYSYYVRAVRGWSPPGEV